MPAHTRLGPAFIALLCMAAMAVVTPEAFALIMGGAGNTPLHDPGWPAGAAAVFNTPSRISWWEGPPFGGGQWHAECRGDAKALSAVLADFAKLDVKSKQVVLHDGIGNAFNNEPAKREAAKMDWRFMVWQPGSWDRQRRLPADISSVGGKGAASEAPSVIDVYTGGNIKWADVTVPKGLTVLDRRLEAHGFTVADGIVLEGRVTDLATNKPIAGANVRLEGAKDSKTTTDAAGHWVLKKAPPGHQLVVEAEGYVPRVVGYSRADGQPGWQGLDSGLARPAIVAGKVLDDAGQPLADAEVHIRDVTASTGERYESPAGYKFKTGADGRFCAEQIPVGRANVWVYKPGYVRPGLGLAITLPKEDIELQMIPAGRVVITVDFTGKERPGGYNVRIAPEGGEGVGKYGGSGNINDKNQLVLENVPPGRYVFTGRPNPGSDKEQTDPITVDIKGGKTTEVKLTPK